MRENKNLFTPTKSSPSLLLSLTNFILELKHKPQKERKKRKKKKKKGKKEKKEKEKEKEKGKWKSKEGLLYRILNLPRPPRPVLVHFFLSFA